jgi:tetratricopeptide (TPR) repeat protein
MNGVPRRAWRIALLVTLLAALALFSTVDFATPEDGADARIAFYRARAGGPATYPAYARLGLAFLQKARESGEPGYLEDAERAFRQSLGYQRNFEALRGLGAALLAQHRFGEALSLAREAVETLPTDPEAHGLLFDIQLALGETQQAAATLDRLLKLETGFAALSRLAALDEAYGQASGALRGMAQACRDAETRSFPRETQAWCQVRLGSIYVALCDATQAEHRYARAVLLLPGYVPAREHLAELRAAQGRHSEAIALYEELLRDSPRPQLRLALAELYSLAGEKEKAAAETNLAREALGRSVGSNSRAEWREWALALLDDPATAAEGLRWAERDAANRSHPLARAVLAWALHRNARTAEAWRTMEPLAQSPDADPAVLLWAAQIRSAMGNREEALRLLDRALACPLRLAPAARARAEQLRRAP